MRLWIRALWLVFPLILVCPAPCSALEATPQLAELLGPRPQGLGLSRADQKAVLDEREVFARARLEGGRDSVQRYSVQSVMLVHSGLARTREVMTQFGRFAGMVPYVEKSDWDPATGRLAVAGGIWRYRLESVLHFEQKDPLHWQFRVVEGHFIGMKGGMQFETAGPGRTLVIFSSEVRGERFPPKWVIERGAEIVFAVTGRRVRSLVEDPPQDVKQETRNGPDGSQVPQPRKRFESR